jgi:hypothetical protein
MKVIFLDIDGVLNNQDYLIALNKDPEKRKVIRTHVRNYSEMIDTRAVELLNVITKTTGAKLVLSSTWRKLHPWDDLVWMFEHRGVVGELIGRTPAGGRSRGHEIKIWLDKHPEATHFIILDDSADISPFESHLIRTRFQGENAGLQQGHVTKAIEMLGVASE